jgi:TRAP-type C4-dicarboxylate transport system permease small subunit
MTNVAYKWFDKVVSIAMATLLALMGIFVFGNVTLRYLFNSGLPWAEELSRFLFVWLIFMGAIGALKDGNHLGFTSLVQRLPHTLKLIAFLLSDTIVLYTLWELFSGSLRMTKLGWFNAAPATNIPMSFMYVAGAISAALMGLVVMVNLYRAFFVKGAIDELVKLKESEEELSSAAETHLSDESPQTGSAAAK